MAERKLKIYVCGPMTGHPDFNRPAFNEVAAMLREQGFEVVTPSEFKQGTWEECMRHAVPQMLACDRVSLLDGWEKSRGARLEAFIARELGMPVETLEQTFMSIPTKPRAQRENP